MNSVYLGLGSYRYAASSEAGSLARTVRERGHLRRRRRGQITVLEYQRRYIF